MDTRQQAQIITPEELETLRYVLPQAWISAAGMLKGRGGPDPVKWQRKIRSEWDKRLAKLARIRKHGS